MGGRWNEKLLFNIKFTVKQCCKMLVQSVIFPLIYNFYKRNAVQENLVIFADARHDVLPFSMECMHAHVRSLPYEIMLYCDDYGTLSTISQLKKAISFMKIYARAKYVFICDNFLPVASCSKREETIVIQLWHGGGMLKKFGYDTKMDIPGYYWGNVNKNCDFVTVSSDVCRAAFASALRLPLKHIHATGISRTDIYYDTQYIACCRREFFAEYPEARGKKIILWAPTFRGRASNPKISACLQKAFTAVADLGKEADIAVFWSFHPHQEKVHSLTNCCISSERVLPVVDVLITDYSSLLFDYLLFEKPFVLFVPDLENYRRERGFYLEYGSLPGTVIDKAEHLSSAVRSAFHASLESQKALQETKLRYMGQCDGNATKRICLKIGMKT